MKHKPLVSIIIPTWNRSKILKKCLLSLKAQKLESYEVIVVDAASSDNSYEVFN